MRFGTVTSVVGDVGGANWKWTVARHAAPVRSTIPVGLEARTLQRSAVDGDAYIGQVRRHCRAARPCRLQVAADLSDPVRGVLHSEVASISIGPAATHLSWHGRLFARIPRAKFGALARLVKFRCSARELGRLIGLPSRSQTSHPPLATGDPVTRRLSLDVAPGRTLSVGNAGVQITPCMGLRYAERRCSLLRGVWLSIGATKPRAA